MTHISSEAQLGDLKRAAELLPPGSSITLARETILSALLPVPPTVARACEDQAVDRWLTAKEVADALSASTRYVYHHIKDFPFAKRLPGGALRFSERGLQHWMQRNG